MKILSETLPSGKKIVWSEIGNNKVEIYLKKAPGKAGKDSKKIVLIRLIELDNFFFENLGLWQAEGGKSKGLYFGNTDIEILLYFLKFVEQRLGTSRFKFNVTINAPRITYSEDEIKERWSKMLRIPKENFTAVCIDPRINEEYAQIYMNGIVLSMLMNNLQEKLKEMVLSNKEFASSYMRGIFAGESSVIFKKWRTVACVKVSSADMNAVRFYQKCLNILSINYGAYQNQGETFPIYGKRNLQKILDLRLMDLSPTKKTKLEDGFGNYQRDLMKAEEMEKLILKELTFGLKTYDELSKALNKGRSTIQWNYIPNLEKRGLVKKIGKRNRAWLFEITNIGKKFLEG
ncbi:MAG: hypothetical protein J4452_00945 [Candidatus Aenigmarchaeota archaeon]|nr:hypothetical protein [Candidatus Aenigmarchaeota archaeon]